MKKEKQQAKPKAKKKEYRRPTLEKRERLVEVTSGVGPPVT